MLPLYLSIEGLYSYQQKQEIDFTLLTEAGLFGIFGKVGSGKSSILEAIGFVLYGETERLNKQEKRTYNMLNLKSNAACIVFEFLNFNGTKYRFVAQWRRRKKFEETTSLERTAYEWQNEQWIPLSSTDGSAITNLTYSNFRRTIIIPQGQFKEFLELRGKDRSEMMKEIFNLNKFDLGHKVSNLQRENNSQLENLKGALSGYEEISTESVQEKELELNSAKQALQNIKSEHTFLEAEITRLTEAKKYRNELTQKKESLTQFNSEEQKIRALENEVEIYENTNNAFRELLNHTHILNKEKEVLTHKIEQLGTKKQTVLEQIELKESQWNEISTEFMKIEKFRIQYEDLKLLSHIAKNDAEFKVNMKRRSDGSPHIEQANLEVQKLTNEVTISEKELEELRSNKVDTSMLLNLETWYQEKENLRRKSQELEDQIQTLTLEQSDINKEFQLHDLTVENWELKITEQENLLVNERNDLHNDQTHLQVQAKLGEFVDKLSDGKPCPLCGALEHPYPMTKSDLFTKENELNINRSKIDSLLLDLKHNTQNFNSLATRFHEKSNSLKKLSTKKEELGFEQENHNSKFIWTNFSIEDPTAFLDYKTKNQNIEDTIKNVENELKISRGNLQAAQIRLEKYQKSLQQIEQNIAISSNIIRQYEGQLRTLERDNFSNESEESLALQANQLTDKIQYLESTYKEIYESLQILKTEFAAINAERNISKEQFQTISHTIGNRQAEISTLLKEHKYSDIIQVQKTLQKNLDTRSLRKTIQEFNLNVGVLRSQIVDLEMRIQSDDFNENDFQEQSELLILKKEELELQVGLTAALQKENQRIQTEYSKKEKLLRNYEILNSRKSNLTTLENLFRGSGFVNYVSSIHLQRLCEIANIRFHRMSKNCLSLAINEQNEFEVIDFLNDGHRRSVKTLSGGQSFQASLCLALALAENIQSLNKRDKNFFFIDEGFGTQDADSINIVFETLQYLRKENRIVGIISHVEELKEKITSAVTVINDNERGSQVTYS